MCDEFDLKNINERQEIIICDEFNLKNIDKKYA